jgi:outer membrane protein assembly factor BamB
MRVDRKLLTGLMAGAVIVAFAGCPKPPRIPETPYGPTTAPKGAAETYSTVTSDPDGLPVSYQFDWGDRTSSGWLGPFPGDSQISDTHAFVLTGMMLARARAKNTKGGTSNWSPPCSVTVIAGESTAKWNYLYYDPENEDFVSFHGSVAASKDGGTIYAASDLGYLHFMDPSGNRKGHPYQLPEDDLINSPSVGSDKRCFVSYDLPAIMAVTPSGSQLWSRSLEVEGLAAIDQSGNVYFNASDGKFYALDVNGADRWPAPVTGGGPSSPAISSDGTIVVVGGCDSLIHAFRTADGAEAWPAIRTLGPIFSSPAISSDNMIYVGSSDGGLRKLKLSGGDPLWEYAANSPISASPVIGPDGTIYVTSENGVLHAVDPSNPQAKWTLPLLCNDAGTAAISSSGILYLKASFPGADDSLMAINLSDHTRRWGVAVAGSGTEECAPLIDSDGAVYVTADTSVACFWGLGGPAQSEWPMFMHDMSRTGQAGSH